MAQGYKSWLTWEWIEENPFTRDAAHEALWAYFCDMWEEMEGPQPDLDTPNEDGWTMRDYCIDSYDCQAWDLYNDPFEWEEGEIPDKSQLAYAAGVWVGEIPEETWDNWTPPRKLT